MLLTIFDKALQFLTSFWKTFLRLKQMFDAEVLIFRLSSFCVPKIYGITTRVTSLEIPPNIADPISLNENIP